MADQSLDYFKEYIMSLIVLFKLTKTLDKYLKENKNE